LNKFTRWLSILLMATLLASCGFQLRGSTPETRLSFESLYLDAPVGTPL
jgi:outer membrane lipopolysaccharide assembly protein LptE/RlpB